MAPSDSSNEPPHMHLSLKLPGNFAIFSKAIEHTSLSSKAEGSSTMSKPAVIESDGTSFTYDQLIRV
jgi:hypothetical protein